MNKLNEVFFLLVIFVFGAASLSANGGDAFIGGFAGGTMGGLVSGAITQKSSDNGDRSSRSHRRLEERVDRIEDAIRKDLEHLYDRVKKLEDKIDALAKGQTETATETSKGDFDQNS